MASDCLPRFHPRQNESRWKRGSRQRRGADCLPYVQGARKGIEIREVVLTSKTGGQERGLPNARQEITKRKTGTSGKTRTP